MKTRNLKLQETKSSLWKLRNKDKKQKKKTEFQEKLYKMTDKMELIRSLLDEAREQDKKMKQEEIQRKERENQTRKVRIQRQEKLRLYWEEKERLAKKKELLQTR